MHRLGIAATTILASALAVLSLVAAPSAVAQSGSGGLTFDGRCQFTGTSAFSSPVTLRPSPTRNSVSATGTCSGSLTSQSGTTTQLNNSPVTYQATEQGQRESCESDLNAKGTGELIFQQGSLSFSVVENRIVGQAALAYTGGAGGSATGVAYVNSSNPAGMFEQCAAGGITSAPVSIVFQTTPTISG